MSRNVELGIDVSRPQQTGEQAQRLTPLGATTRLSGRNVTTSSLRRKVGRRSTRQRFHPLDLLLAIAGVPDMLAIPPVFDDTTACPRAAKAGSLVHAHAIR
jgi:hypothetical protein